MEKRKILLGESDFRNMINHKGYYVDKTLFIKEVVDNGAVVQLFTRPRRFGKTLNLSMLRYFFDVRRAENRELFQGLNIWHEQDIMQEQCCQHPVIFLTFKDVKANTWEESLNLIKDLLTELYQEFRFLLESETLQAEEKEVFRKILSKTALQSEYELSIKKLSKFLHEYYGKQVFIIIDEYDAPIQSGYDKYYDQVVSFMRNLLSGAFKDNPNLYKGVITGILRVSKESIFSGLNNLKVFSILENRFANKFGFTEEEVIQLLRDYDKLEKLEQVRRWYNGYRFGNTENIYNPWSLLNFVDDPDSIFQSYWTQTSANDLIKSEIKKQDAEDLRRDLQSLLGGETIQKYIEENFVFSDLKRQKDLLWTLMLFSGYLTVVQRVDYDEYELRIPNFELKLVFKRTVLEWLNYEVKMQNQQIRELAKSLIQGRLQDFERYFRQVMGDTFSYYDTARFTENVYHAYVLGLLAILSEDYVIRSNRESGEGRYDILLIPKNRSENGVVIEIKNIDRRGNRESDDDFAKRVERALSEAREQIERKGYYRELIDHGLSGEQIIKVPIVFAGKQAFVGK